MTCSSWICAGAITTRLEHVPDAVQLDYACLLAGEKPATGRLPSAQRLSEALCGIGFEPRLHVVAYDDEGGGHASRLLWTLHVLGHRCGSLLNGGFDACKSSGLRLSSARPAERGSEYAGAYTEEGVADIDYIESRLGDCDFALLDARSPKEYSGKDLRALRGGHIPGAVNLDWLDTIDVSRDRRLRPDDELRALLRKRNLTPDKEIICYCQTHHRSSHSYVMLKHLGYPRVRGYAGSWAEWGNHEKTPVESP